VSIKDDLNAVKEELNAQEEMLKNVIHIERFYKKYKGYIIGASVIVVVGFFGWVAKNQIAANTLTQTNVILYQLKSDKNNQTLLSELELKNPKLYHFYMLQEMIKDKKYDEATAHAKTLDPFIQDMVAYQVASASQNIQTLNHYSGDLDELALLESGYLSLKENNFEEAKKTLSKLAITSPLNGYAQALLHYKKGN